MPPQAETVDSESNLPTVFDPETCTRKGLCPVTQIRNKGDPFESHSLYYEQHGSGPEKILFIMGYVPVSLRIYMTSLISCIGSTVARSPGKAR